TRPEAVRCRLERSFLRGPSLTALDLDAAAADVFLDQVLFAGGSAPALDVRPGDDADRPATLRVYRSTLLTGDGPLLRVRKPAAAFRPGDDPADRVVAYAGTVDPRQPLGIDVAALPPTRDRWPGLAFGRADLLLPDPPEDRVPEVLKTADGVYHGEEIDLAKN